MPEKPRIIAMIPARIGSTRLKRKNLALLGGRPMISYVIESAKKSGVFSRIILNSDSKIFLKIAKDYEIEFYLRPERLGASMVQSDEVVQDFVEKHPCEIVAWVNSIAPFQPPEEIRAVVGHFLEKKLDSLITVSNQQVHCLHKGRPVNFSMRGKFARTQDLLPVQAFVYSIMMWNAQFFIREMNKKGYAFFSGKVGFYPVGKLSSFLIKTPDDLAIAEGIHRHLAQGGRIRYYSASKKSK